MNLRIKSIAAAAALVGGFAAGPASAMLVLVSPTPIGGTGLGTVATLLTIQSPANSSTESGAVSRSGGADVITGDALTGASQTLTRSFGEVGIVSSSEIGIVFNASEPSGNSITLSGLSLSIYSATGSAALFTSGAVSCGATNPTCTFANSFTGTGNSGFLFQLDAAQAAAAAPFVTATNRIGLSGSALDATGGNETFFLARVAGTVTPPIPEPETYALMLGGLGMLAFMARRRRA